jgi:hypothetical protein
MAHHLCYPARVVGKEGIHGNTTPPLANSPGHMHHASRIVQLKYKEPPRKSTPNLMPLAQRPINCPSLTA